jgi:hypothetical protein
MPKTVVYLSRLPAIQILSKPYGIDCMSKRGLDVIFLDLSSFLEDYKFQSLYARHEILQCCKVIKIHTLHEFDRFVASIQNVIYIDFVDAISLHKLNSEGIYRVLKRFGAIYYIVHGGLIPKPINEAPYLLRFIKKIFQKNISFFDLIVGRMAYELSKKKILYPTPARIFGMSGNEVIENYMSTMCFSKIKFTPVGSHDFYDYLEYLDGVDSLNQNKSKTCVFIDEGYTNHPDYFLLQIQPINEQAYIASLNRLFDYLERKYLVTVLIAGHPKSLYTEESNPFCGRPFIKGAAVDLIAKATMVISHASTAIGYVALFNKPLTIISTKEIEKNPHISSMIKAFCGELCVDSINIDEYCKIEETNFKSTPSYKSYLNKYVFNKDVSNKFLWDVVADAVYHDLLEDSVSRT